MTTPVATPIPCESIPGHADFRHLDSIDNIQVQLRYATSNNFVGRDLYSPLDCRWLHRNSAASLERSIAWLKVQRPDLQLFVLDALRPQRVQEQLWAALQGTNLLEYLANPVRGSIHSFGMAIDITLVTIDGVELDMGTPFDDLTALSHPSREQEFLAGGELTQQAVDNRLLLREAMHQGGWASIKSEWWHFDCGNRDLVRATYPRVL